MLRLLSARRVFSASRGFRVTAAAAAAATAAHRSVALVFARSTAQRRQFSTAEPKAEPKAEHKADEFYDTPWKRIGLCVGAVGLAAAAALSYHDRSERTTVNTIRSKILASTAQPNLTPGVGVVQSAFSRELDVRYAANEFLYVEGPAGVGKSVCVLAAALCAKRPVVRVSLKQSDQPIDTQLSALFGVKFHDTLLSARATTEYTLPRALHLLKSALEGLPEEKRPVLIIDDVEYLGKTCTAEEKRRQENVLSAIGQLAAEQHLLTVVMTSGKALSCPCRNARAVRFPYAAKADVAAAMAAGDANGNRAFTSEREITTVLDNTSGHMRVVNDCATALRAAQRRVPAGATLSADARLQTIQQMLAVRQADAIEQLNDAFAGRQATAARVLTALSKTADPFAPVDVHTALASPPHTWDGREISAVLSSLDAAGVVVCDGRLVRWATPMAYATWQQHPLRVADDRQPKPQP